MKKFLKKRVNFNKKKLKFIILGIIGAGFLIFVFYQVMPSLNGEIKPAVQKKVDQNLEMEVVFNDFRGEPKFSKEVISAIDSSEKSIDIVMYSFDSEEIRDSLKNALKRGVKIRMVLNYFNNSANFFSELQSYSNFKLYMPNQSDIRKNFIHHKFAIFDKESNKKQLISGAWNWTLLQEKYDSSYIFKTRDELIINEHVNEFERLFSGFFAVKKFKKSNYYPFAGRFNYLNGFLEIWWAPGNKQYSIRNMIYNNVANAKSSIKIAIWFWNDQNLLELIKKKADEGVKVEIIADDYQNFEKDLPLKILRDEIKNGSLKNIELISDEKRTTVLKTIEPEMGDFNPFFHNHFIIIDDSNVIFGTGNFSKSAYFSNDENFIVSNCSSIVNQFLNNFKTQKNELLY